MSSKDKDTLARIRSDHQRAVDYWHENYTRGLDDLRFVTERGGQWDAAELQARKSEDLPCLEFNLLHSFVKQQINGMRQNRPSILVEPADTKSSVETAKILKGLVRDIEVNCGADMAYDTAVSSAAYRGIGFIRVVADYVDDQSFEQEPKILTVHNADAVYIDPQSRELDGSDASWALVLSWVDRDTVAKQYGEDAVADFDSGDTNWVNESEKTVCLAEHFEIVRTEADLYLLPDGSTTFDLPPDVLPVSVRKSYKKRCVWTKASGVKVLEQRDFVVPYIPIIPVYGMVVWVGSKRHVFSMIHHAKNAQKLFNLYKSGEAFMLAESMREQWITPVQAIAGIEDDRGQNPWSNPSGSKILYYNHVEDASGQALPAPQIKPVNAALPAIMSNMDKAQQLIEQQLNMQPAAMGANVSQQSGKAIQLLQQRADVSQFHLIDNLNKSLEWLGVILIAMIQALYDVRMVKRITGNDGKAKTVTINEQSDSDQAIDGLLNNVTVGRYDVRISTGASYVSQRQEAQDRIQELVRAVPQLGQVAPDLLVGLFADLPEIEALAERLKRSLPPQLTAEDANGEDPKVQQVMAQAKAQMDQLQQALQQAQAEASDKEAERQLKLAIAELQAHVTMKKAELDAQVKLATAVAARPLAELPDFADISDEVMGEEPGEQEQPEMPDEAPMMFDGVPDQEPQPYMPEIQDQHGPELG